MSPVGPDYARAAFDGSGNVHALLFAAREHPLRVTLRRPGSGFAPPRAISTGHGIGGELAINERGDGVASWTAPAALDARAYVARRR
jgi:hypothetical protein